MIEKEEPPETRERSEGLSYTVTLTFPQEAEDELRRLRKKYNQYSTYQIDPHITLQQPFYPTRELNLIHEKLEAVSEGKTPFVLELDGVEYFTGRNNVAYVAVKNKQPVIQLYTAIANALKGLINEGDEGEYKPESFTPHVTIGERIPDDIFPTVRQELSNCRPNFQIPIRSFSLYFAGKAWGQVKRFDFSIK